MCSQLIIIAQQGFGVLSYSLIKLLVQSLEQGKKSKAIPRIIKERNRELIIKHKYHTQQTKFLPIYTQFNSYVQSRSLTLKKNYFL